MNMLKTSPVLQFWETVLWERSPGFSLLAASNKSFLLSLFDFVASFGSTPTKRQTQFFGNGKGRKGVNDVEAAQELERTG